MLASNVKIIEPTKIDDNKSFDIIRRNDTKRVCAYCRVSTDSEEQKNSYNSQVTYYKEFIMNHPGWIFTKIYADEGITGTSMRKREHFREMIQDAMDGKIDMILCKSVSRFARNVVDILNVIEQLNQKGVPILFENENLNSLDDKQGTRLQILISAANAEDYSQSLSESVKWGRIRQIEQGNYPITRCYGYIVKNKKMTVNKKEAEVVKFIYQSFLNGDSYRQICRKLEERKIPSPFGKEKWQCSTVEDILANVRYKGDLHLQKFTSSDIKFRKRVPNTTGKQYYITDHHTPIITKAQWNQVEKERKYRANLRGFGDSGKSTYTSKYPFSNKICCLQCGSRFRRHRYTTAEGEVITWVCSNHKKSNKNCTQLPIIESKLENAFVEALNDIIDNKEQVLDVIVRNIHTIIKDRKQDNTIDLIDAEIKAKQENLMALIQGIGTSDTFQESQRIMNEIESLKAKRNEIEQSGLMADQNIYRIEELQEKINSMEVFDKFNGGVFKQLVDKVQIDGNKAIFVFNNLLRVEKIVK